MARSKGVLGFSGNFEPQAAAPFDARMRCGLKSDLINEATWQALDGISYAFVGMLTIVTSDPLPENNGGYYLRALPLTDPANWAQLGSGGSAGSVDYTTQVSGKPTINGVEVVGDLTSADLKLDFLKAIPVSALPDPIDTASLNTIYLIPNATDPNVRDEYMVKEGTPGDTSTWSWEAVGSTNVTLDDYYTKLEIDEKVVFAGTDASVEAVGGIKAGTVMDGYDLQKLIEEMFFPEKFPTLSAPSASISTNQQALIEVGLTPSIEVTGSFSQGSISPQYTAASDKRSGLPNTYTFTGPALAPNVASTDLSTSQTINYAFTALGAVTWTCVVSFDAGVQPKSSKDNDFNTPLAAGDTSPASVTITAVNPYFATTNSISTLTKRPLVAPSAAMLEVVMVAEDDVNKQTIEYGREMGAVTGIKVLNTISGKYEYLGGSASESLSQFTASDITVDVNGTSQPYYRYTHNGDKIGSRTLQFEV